MKAKLFITGLALMAATAIVSAQTPDSTKRGGHGKCNETGKCAQFVDNNKNGVCDNFENRQANASGCKGKGHGKCDGTGNHGKGKNYVDANKNGVCDNQEKK